MTLFRMWDWLVYAVILFVIIALVAPQQVPVVAYKASLLALAVILAYMADRSLFKRVADQLDGRMARDLVGAARVISRALIFLGVCIVFGMGV